MNIWEERYTSEKYGLEPPSSYKTFKRLLNDKTLNRNLQKLAEQLVYEKIENDKQHSKKIQKEYKKLNQKEIDKKIKQKYSTISTFSSKYNYKERFKAYDDYYDKEHKRIKKEIIREMELENLNIIKETPKYHADTLSKIHNDKTTSNIKKAYAEKACTESIKTAIETGYLILDEGTTKTENKNTDEVYADVKTEITEHKTIEEKNKENDEYFKQLENDME